MSLARYDRPPLMDLSFSPEEEAFRAECRAWLEANVPRPALPSGDTRAGFAAHLEWERALFDARFAVVSWPAEFGGRDASLWEWLIFEEEYYRAGAPQRVTQNGIFLLAPTIFEFGTPEQQARILPEDGVGRADVVPGLVGAQRRQRPRRHPEQGGARRRRAAAGGCPARRRGRHAARSARTSSGCSAATPTPNAITGSPTSSSTSRRPGVTVRGVERLDGDEGFAEVFLDDVFVPDADVLGEPNQGWAVAMATTGSERGLTLRSPGRFLATAQRLIDLYHDARRRSRAPRPRRRRVHRRGGVPLADVLDRHPPRRRGAASGAESSMVKVFWSELDVRLHELALELLGPHAELLDGDDRRVDEGLRVRARGPDLRGHERDPAQRDRRARARTAEALTMRFAFTDDQIAFRDAVRELLDKECTPAHVRDAWTNDTGRVPGLWDKLAEMGVVGMLAPEARRRARAHDGRPRAHPRGDGPVRGARADRRDRGVRRPAARPRRPHDRRRERDASVPWADTADVIITPAGRFERGATSSWSRTRRSTARAGCSRCGARPTPVAPPTLAAAFDRAVDRHRRAAVRPRAAHARHDRRLRQGTQAVRRARSVRSRR